MKKQIVIAFFSALASSVLAGNSAPALIPAPQKMEIREGVFELTAKTRVSTDAASVETGKYLATQLRKATGYAFAIGDKAEPGVISLTTNNAPANLGREGYELTVASNSVVIRATTQTGLFYGVQSLLQLAPPEIFAATPATNVSWRIPCVHIEDQPRFQWRGFMLDVSRHFFNKDEIKRVLDLMALHKENIFHWHLVDDHGWRIEIKKYPRLTQVGAWRAENGFGLDPKSTTAYGKDGRYGGFYTQTDIHEIVAYAAARHITIVPEIEMPGHSTAALAAYPEFSCFGGPFAPETNAGVFNGIYCAGKEQTFVFLQDVLNEVFELFPGKMVHIGGDEVPTINWRKCPQCQARIKQEGLKDEPALQGYFIRRIEKFVNAKGKTLIGWSETREDGLGPSAALMDWIGGGLDAAREGHDVVMTPVKFCYLDFYQSLDTAIEPKAVGGFLPLSKVYSFEPVPAELPVEKQSHILGGQGNLWTEYIPSLVQAEYMMFPRLAALAEVNWSPKDARDFAQFQKRLEIHNRRLDQLQVNYRRDNSVQLGEWMPAQITATNKPGSILEWNVTPLVTATGQYRVVFEPRTGTNALNIFSATLLEDGQEVARDTHYGVAGASPKRTVYILNLPAWKPGANYILRAVVTGEGGTDSRGIVSWTFKPAGIEHTSRPRRVRRN
jgi:hexosaminidase